ncbi:FxSxx-COOH system tetratricopeptide repeat protein [Streptomyces broussonetiae]|uniref:FxSxx-COOH system tetratricopeptide repeat protein n=1 Tax=Streptomyces broussonetiae TaxID=2686304 RepID=A0ABV5EHE0_9ACTN
MTWPHQVGVLPRHADHFQDRRAAAQLERAVAGTGTAAQCQVLVGMGGVGKTQLAAHYARTAWEDSNLDVLIWITASARSLVVTGYAQAGIDLCQGDPDAPDQAAQAFLAWLTPKAGQTPCRWLIVLDDVADPDDLRGLWPPSSPYGRTLITTRRRDAALTGDGRRRIDVGLFTKSEAVTYLTRYLEAHGRTESADQLSALAFELGCLPLALSQAAAYLIDSGEDVTAYRELLTDRTIALADAVPDRLPDDQTIPLAAAWSLSIDRADNLRPVGLARPMLYLTALLDSNGIPQAALTSDPVLAYLAHTREVTERDALASLRALHRLSLIDHNPNTPYQAVRVHQLIQRATRDALTLAQRDQLVRTAADAVLAAWPAPGEGAAAAASLRANSDALAQHGEEALYRTTMHRVLLHTGQSLGETGQVKAAVEYFTHLTDTAHRRLGSDHPASLVARRHLAVWRAEAGDIASAVAELERLLESMLRSLGPEHPETLTARNNLAHWRGAAGDPAGAVAELERLVESMVRSLGPEHPETLTARNNLAWQRAHAGDEARAVTEFEQLQLDQERVLGQEHQDTLLSAGNLAWCRREAGDAAGALAELEPLVERSLQALGPDHRITLATTHTQAITLAAVGDAAGAVRALERVLERMQGALDPNHPDIFYARSNLASFKAQAGDLAGAVDDFEPLIQQAMRTFRPSDIITQYTQAAAANTAVIITGLLDRMLHVLDPDHHDALLTRHNLAHWRGEAGDAAGAAAALAELLNDRERALGPHHPDTLATRDDLAHWQGRVGDPAVRLSTD